MTDCMSSQPETLLIVDDGVENLAVLSEILRPHYAVRVANTGEKALRVARIDPVPDLILLDVMMPVMDGYEVFSRLRADPATRAIPVIFVTAMDTEEAEVRGLELGAVDYLTKPIVPAVALARVRTHLELNRVRARLEDQNAWLESEVRKHLAEHDIIQMVSIRALAHLAEIRDPETGNHILRTQYFVGELAGRLKRHSRYAETIRDQFIGLLTRSAPLHDIGKVGIPDAILCKPGPLTPEEWVVMETHAKLGAEAIELAERDVRREVEFLRVAKEIARWHHEKWDGTGYPDGLKGDSIPLGARIMAVADVFDALVSPRVYKVPMDFNQARQVMRDGRGSHFDPVVCDAFLKDYGTFVDIAKKHADGKHI